MDSKKSIITLSATIIFGIIFVAVVIVVLPQKGIVARESNTPQTSVQPIKMRLNLGPTEPQIDPSIGSGNASLAVIDQLFLGLTRWDEETGEAIPELAASWVASPDATVFTFTLRSDAYWTDGEQVTSRDVEYGILRSLDPATNAGWEYPLFVIENAEAYNNGNITDPDLVGITDVSRTKIRFDLNQPASYFPSVLAIPAARALPKGVIQTHGNAWTDLENIVTNGPYELREPSINLVKNDSFYNAGDVSINRVKFRTVDDTTGWEMYNTGDLDSDRVPNDQWGTAQSDPDLAPELVSAPSTCTYFYGFNTSKAPFDNPLVRKAFISAVDRQGVIDDGTGYAQIPALTFTPPGVFGHVDGYTAGVGLPYNATQAQQYLSDAGYPGGAGLPPITLMYNTSTGHQNIARAVQDDWWVTLGVSVTLSDLPWSDYLDLLSTDPPQIWRMGWCSDHTDAYNFLYDSVIPSKDRWGGWTNLTYEGYLDTAAVTVDLGPRADFYRYAEEILVETDAVMLPLYFYANGYATKPYLDRTFRYGGVGGWIADWQFSGMDYTYADTLDLNLGSVDQNFDPGLGSTNTVIDQLFVGLTRADDETGEPLPELATTWEASPDAAAFTFTLRSDAVWTDGTPLTAGDIRYGILRNLDPGLGSGYVSPLFVIVNASEYNNGDITDPNLVGITVLDDTHIRFDLTQSTSFLPSILDIRTARPLPEWTITEHGDGWTHPDNIVSSGPYRLQKESINLEKSPTFYGAADVQIEVVEFRMEDESTAWDLYQEGLLDSAQVPFDQWTSVQSDPDLAPELTIAPRNCTYYYGFNITKAPFDDPLVRKAFIAAVDRQGVIDEALGGPQNPALTFAPPTVFGHVDGYAAGVGIPHNPTQAQTDLSVAGYPGGVGLPPVTLVFNTSTGHQDIANAIQEDWWVTLGVSVTLSDLPWNDYLDLLSTDPPQIWRLGWCADHNDAYNFLFDGVVPPKDRWGGWTNPTYEGLLETAAATLDLGSRAAVYQSAEEILVETDAVMLPLYFFSSGYATKPYLDRTYGGGGLGGWIADWRITLVEQVLETTGGTLTSIDGDVVITIPGGTFPEPVMLTYSPCDGSPPAWNLAGFGQCFEINAYYASTGLEAFPSSAYLLEVFYDEADLGLIPEDTLALYYWSEPDWIMEPTSVVDTVNNLVTATPDHFSFWSLIGEIVRVFTPLVQK
jgi:oligopeptide transport system substrate-binding protein